jgi:hypothetical protein
MVLPGFFLIIGNAPQKAIDYKIRLRKQLSRMSVRINKIKFPGAH